MSALSRRAVLGGAFALLVATGMPSVLRAESAPLKWDVFVAPPLPVPGPPLPPDGQLPIFPPVTATLIYGERDAVLVDGLLTAAQGEALADWIKAHGKTLTTIYATHAHPDHFFGTAMVLQKFPQARFVALPAVVAKMRTAIEPRAVAVIKQRFPDEPFEHLAVAEPLAGTVIALEGRDLVAVPLGHTDTDDTTCLHVPSLGLVVAGDAVYNDVHPSLREFTPERASAWIAALDQIEALKPRVVVAGHKRPGIADDPKAIEETRQYIRDFARAAETSTTAQQLYDRMIALYPQRVNPNSLRLSAAAVKG